MQLTLRRIWMCIRIGALMLIGAGVVHLAAVAVGEPARVHPRMASHSAPNGAKAELRAVEPTAAAAVKTNAAAAVKEVAETPTESAEAARHALETAKQTIESASQTLESVKETVAVAKDVPEPVAVDPSKTADPSQTADLAKTTPLPGSNPGANLEARLAEKGLSAGNPVMIRIFKAESQLEVWMQNGERYELFASYSICRWSGKLGPKLHEGDKQAPEGIYTVSTPQIHRRGRWPRAFNIGFPNAFDRAMERTGSLILVHGGCSSIGCFAMTNPQMDEIYKISELALNHGQARIPVHVFPFRMTDENLVAHSDSEWLPFWRNLREVYDAFERARTPPTVNVCGKRYVVNAGSAPVPAADCTDTYAGFEPEESAKSSEAESADRPAPKAHKVVSKTQKGRVSSRNARKNYAEARKTRMAEHAEKARSKQASAGRRTQ